MNLRAFALEKLALLRDALFRAIDWIELKIEWPYVWLQDHAPIPFRKWPVLSFHVVPAIILLLILL